MRSLKPFCLAVLLLLLASPVLAAVAYVGVLTIANSTGTSYTMLSVITPADITFMSANGFIASNGSDVQLQNSGGTAQPMMLTGDRIVTAVAVPATSNVNLNFTTGNTFSATAVSGTGTVTGSPLTLSYGSNNVSISVAGTITVTLASGWHGTAESDGWTVTGSPVFVDAGANTVTIAGGGAGNIKVYITNYAITVGNGGYVTTSDAAALEPGAGSFELEWQGYFDAGATGEILCKTDSYCLDVAVAGTVRGYVGIQTAGSVTLRPNAAGDANAIPSETGCAAGASHYLCVDEAVADDAVTMVQSSGGGSWYDYYNIDDNAFPSYAVITSVVVYHRTRTTLVGAFACVRPVVRLGGVDVEGACSGDGAGVWTDYNGSLSRPGGGSWATTDINSLQVGLRHQGAGAGDLEDTTQVYVVVNYDSPVNTVLTAAVTGGIRKVKFTKSAGVDLELLTATCTSLSTCGAYVSQDTDAAPAATIQDISTTILSSKSGPAVWSSYLSLTIGGTRVLRYQPVNIISGTTLPDLEGAAQNGVITWGSNPAGVTGLLNPLAPPAATSAVTATPATRDVLPAVSTGDWFGGVSSGGSPINNTEGPNSLNNPLRPLVTTAVDIANMDGQTHTSNTQVERLFGYILLFVVLVVSLVAMKGHLLVAGITVSAVSISLTVYDSSVYPAYVTAIIIACLVAGIVAERSPSV